MRNSQQHRLLVISEIANEIFLLVIWSIEWNNKIGGKICHDDKKLS